MAKKAKLVLERLETNPYNDDGMVQVAYFDGTPTRQQLEEVAEEARAGSDAAGGERERRDDDVSRRAGLQRWLLFPA